MTVLADLPEPLSEISHMESAPSLRHNEQNHRVYQAFRKQRFISSMKEKSDSIIINTFKSSDHSEEND